MTENASSEPSEVEGQPPSTQQSASGLQTSGDAQYPEGASHPEGAWHLKSSVLPIPSFGLLLVLFVAFRLLTLFLLRPGGFIRDYSDFDNLLGIAAVSDYGLYPFFHYWLEWPPLVPWLAVGAYKLSTLFPPWTDPRLWFVLILGSVFLLFETGNFVLLYRIARRFDTRVASESRTQSAADNEPENQQESSGSSLLERPPGTGWLGQIDPGVDYAIRVIVLYSLLFVPIYAMLGFFDVIALFFLLLALNFILGGRLVSSAISIGIGFLVKVMPLIFVPVALRQLWVEAEDGRAWLRDSALYLVTTALTTFVLLLPFLLSQPIWLWTSARAMVGRSSWETVWAILEGYFGFGAVAGDRLNPAETSFAIHASSLPWWLITLGFGLIYLMLWSRSLDRPGPRGVVALTGLTMTLFLLYFKGYSPQFLVYLLPFVILLFPDARGVTYGLLLTLLNVLEQPVYFVLVSEATWFMKGIVLARWLVLAALLVEFSLALWGPRLQRLSVPWRYAPVGLSVLMGLWLAFALPALGRAYAENRLGEDTAASIIGYLGTEQAQAETKVLIVTDQEFLRRARPYLVSDYDVRLAGGDQLYNAAPSVAELVSDLDKVWVVASGDDANAVERSLAGQGRPLLTYDFGEAGELQLFALQGTDFVGRRAEGAPLPPLARLTSGANLIGFTLQRPARDQVRVTLYWWAATTPARSYTVFTQLLDANGDLVAGHDDVPASGSAPTHEWTTGRVYVDRHVVRLPEDLPKGEYRVVAGMYDVNGNRLIATGPDAAPFPARAVPLGEIRLP